MMVANLQAALAHALVDEDVRTSLHRDPAAFQRRFALTDEQMAHLGNVDTRRLALTAQVGRAKRLDFLRRGLPVTLHYLRLAGRHELLHEFVRVEPAPVDGAATSRALSESRRFAGYLATQGRLGPLDWIREVAAFELVKLDLLASKEASESAARAAERPASPGGRVVLGGHVRIATFACDVLELSSPHAQELPSAVTPAPTYLTVVKRLERPFVIAYRTGEIVAAMLRLCAEPRTVAEVVAAAGAGNDQRATQALHKALTRGVLARCGSAR